MPHFELIHLICAGVVAVAALLIILHILFTMRDDSERASLWIILVLCIPVLGIILYLLAGITRRNTLGKRISHAVEEFLKSRDEAEHRSLPSPSRSVITPSRSAPRKSSDAPLGRRT